MRKEKQTLSFTLASLRPQSSVSLFPSSPAVFARIDRYSLSHSIFLETEYQVPRRIRHKIYILRFRRFVFEEISAEAC